MAAKAALPPCVITVLDKHSRRRASPSHWSGPCSVSQEVVGQQKGKWCAHTCRCRDSLLFNVVRQDEGFELEVTDPKDKE